MYVKCLTIAHTDKVSQKNNPGETVRPIRLHHQLPRMRTLLKLNAGSKTDSAKICTPRPNESGRLSGLLLTRTHSALHAYVSSALQATISGLPRCKNPSTFSLFPFFCYSPKFYSVDFFFPLFYVTREYYRFLRRGWADISLSQAHLRSKTTFLLMEGQSVDLSRPHWGLFLAGFKLKALWPQTPACIVSSTRLLVLLSFNLTYNSSYLLFLKNHQSKKVPATNMTERQ